MTLFEEFLGAYMEAALWSSTGEDGRPLDDDFGIEDIAPKTADAMRDECRAFFDESSDFAVADVRRAGVDFWLTRNRHGSGFWDGGWGKEEGRVLTERAKLYGSADLYVGVDGLVWQHGTEEVST